MSDLDMFGDVPQSDPAADFLAEQQQKLAGLMDDDLGGFGDIAQPSATTNDQTFYDGGLLGADSDFFSGATTEQHQQQHQQQQQQQDNSFEFGETNNAAPQAAPKQDMYSALRNDFNESEKVRTWREQQRERLTKKDADEELRRSECYASAKRETEEWYKHYEEQIGKTRSANREMEKILVAERGEPLPTGPGNQAVIWDRVCRLCDFNPKNVKCQKDVSRLRALLLQLKQTPPIRS